MIEEDREVISRPWTVKKVDKKEIDPEEFPGQPYSLNEEGFENFVVDHEDHGMIGSGDLYSRDGYSHLRGAIILPDYRGLNHGGSSPFGDLIERRLSEIDDNAVQTASTTRHGKTQYKYEQFGFHPTGMEPAMASDQKPLVNIWKKDYIRNPEIYVPEEIEDFVDASLNPIIGDVNYGDYSENGFQVGSVDFPEDYDIDHITVGDGETSAREAAERIVKSEDSRNYCSHLVIELRNTGNGPLIRELQDRDYQPIGIEPEVENCRHYPEPELRMIKLRSPLEDLYLTESSLEIVEESGLNYSIDRGEKSHRFGLEPTV